MNGTQMEQAQAHGMVPKQGKELSTFSETVQRLRAQDASKVDAVISTTQASLVATVNDGIRGTALVLNTPELPQLHDQEFGITEHAHHQIAARSQVDWKLYNRLRTDHPDLLAGLVTPLWEREPERRMVRTFINGHRVARAVVSDRFRVVDNLPFLVGALEEAERYGAQVHSATVDDTRLYVKLLTPRVGEVKRGDPIQAGVILRNSEVGDGKVVVAPFVLRLVCTNGAVSPENFSKMHLGGELDEGIQSQETQLKHADLIFSQIRDYVRFALADENLEKIVAAFQRAEVTQIEAPAKIAVANVVRLGGLGKLEADGVLARFMYESSDAGPTQFALVNSVTHLAHTNGSNYRRQVELEELGGKLLNMEMEQFTRFASKPLSDKELENTFSAS